MRYVLILVMAWLSSMALRVQWLDPAFEQTRAAVSQETEFIRSPGRQVLALASFEHPFAWADLIWLSIVQETGKQNPDWNRVVRWTEVGTDLDLKYYTVYHSAAVQLSVFARRIDDADALLLKGWTQLPERWQFPMLLGYNAYFVRGDALGGADYMRAAADTPGSPPFLAALAGRMRYHGGDAQGAIEMLESMLPALEDSARRDAEERILMLRSEPLLTAYDQACRTFRTMRGVRPTALQLHEEGWVEAPPRDLLGYDIELDEDCVARTEVIIIREAEAARERVGAQRHVLPPSLPDDLSSEEFEPPEP